MSYQDALIAAGTLPEHAAFLAQRDELRRFENLAHPSYGVYDPDPPSAEEVREAFNEKYGLAQQAR